MQTSWGFSDFVLSTQRSEFSTINKPYAHNLRINRPCIKLAVLAGISKSPLTKT